MEKIGRLYNIKIIQSGDNVEVYHYSHYMNKLDFEDTKPKTHADKKVLNSKREKHKQTIRDKEKNLNKSKNNIRRLIKANEKIWTTFITLTFSDDKMKDYQTSKKYLSKFFDKMRKKQKDFKYIWILELSPTKKRLHYHLLTNIAVPKGLKLSTSKQLKSEAHKLYEADISKIWGMGFVDIKPINYKEDGAIRNVSLYVSSYITKDLLSLDLKGNRCYGCSKTLNKPTVSKVYSNQPIEEVMGIFLQDYQITFTNSYNIGYYDTIKDKQAKGNVLYYDMRKVDKYEN